MTTNDTSPDSPSTPPTRPITAAEISAFLHHLTQLRSPAHTNDQAKRAAVLAHKAELFDRIADHHTGPDQAHARQIAQHARAAAAAAEQLPDSNPDNTSEHTIMINTPTAQPGRLTNHTTRRR
jgi:hypothetical protein